MYKLYYIHIAIIHIIILNKVHCNLLKAIDARIYSLLLAHINKMNFTCTIYQLPGYMLY